METGTLFKIETDCVSLTWSKGRGTDPQALKGRKDTTGRLCLHKRRDDLSFHKIYRATIPEIISSDPDLETGPLLYEQSDYKLYVKAAPGKVVSVLHRDPLICRDLTPNDNGNVVYGLLNFGSQVGRSEFNVLVDDKPEFDFEVEIFPSKLDYADDYAEILAEVQEILTGLALEYLRSTYNLGNRSHVPQPTHLEWILLLKGIAGRLESALQQIARHPVRGLVRVPATVRVEKIKRVDSAVRSAVRRGTGSGEFVQIGGGLGVRQRLEEHRAHPTLDTPEHRWLAAQLNRIRQRLGWMRRKEAEEADGTRRKRILNEMDELESRISRLCQLEPIAAAEGNPPQGFTSLQLLCSPGYREAYQQCMVLMLGLRIEGGPLRLSVKDLNLLYEYWCYLALLRIVSEETKQPVPAKSVFAVKQDGLRVLLERGRKSVISFDTASGRKITVSYNPRFQGEPLLVPQQPDMMISLEDPDWPTMHLLTDAKYRVDASPEYIVQYGSPGPPDDAVNVLHRYRDAILENDPQSSASAMPKRTIVQAAALFPYREDQHDQFRGSRLWQALERIGIGAIPMLPGDTRYLSEWLRTVLREGGWALSDRAILHRSGERARDWCEAAAEAVLVGILRSGERGAEARHLEWIKRERCYYIPVPVKETQKRFLVARWVAIYLPAALRKPGAVTCWAKVNAIDIVPRKDIPTPWPASRNLEELQYVYRLENIADLQTPIENQSDDGVSKGFRTHRWTSRLALQRARTLKELSLETEPEWRLYEDLRASGIPVEIEPGPAKVVNPDDPSGRAWFVTNGGRIQYRGAGGYLLRPVWGQGEYHAHPSDVIAALGRLSSGFLGQNLD